MRSQEFTGKTTQDAINAGLAALGVTIADVHVDVLEEGAKGLFGLFGSKPARVRITVMEEEKEDDHGLSDLLGSFSLDGDARRRKQAEKKPAAQPKSDKPAAQPKAYKPAAQPKSDKPAAQPKSDKPAAQPKSDKPAAAPKADKPAPAEEKADKPAAPKPEKKPAQPKAEKKPAARKPKPEKKSEQPAQEAAEEAPRAYAPMAPAQPFTPTEPPVLHDEATPAGRAQRFLMDVTQRMGVKVDVYVDDSEADSLTIHMIGDTLGILIGRRGETLDALQYLTSLQVNKGREGYIRVTLDTENYRAKREDSLRRLAQRMANRAQKTGRKVVLEPMNPYERRVLHTALQNHPNVSTHSEGEEPNRRVVITLKNTAARDAQQGERADKEGKPSSGRRRSHRRGRRGPKNPAQGGAMQTAAQADNTQEAATEQGGEE